MTVLSFLPLAKLQEVMKMCLQHTTRLSICNKEADSGGDKEVVEYEGVGNISNKNVERSDYFFITHLEVNTGRSIIYL